MNDWLNKAKEKIADDWAQRSLDAVKAQQNAKMIEVGIVAKKIAESLVQLPDTPPLLVAIQKKIPQSAPNHYRIADLTDDDVQLLRSMWADLPIPPFWNMTREQFAICKTVFEAATNKPEWDIQTEFRDYQAEAKSERGEIAIQHMRQIEAEVKQGRFEILTSHRIPTDKLEPGTLMRISDARTYLQSLGLDSSCLNAIEAAPIEQPAPTPKAEAAPDDGIKAIGQILAGAGMGVLALEVAKREAIQQLQESPTANNLLNRYIALQPKGKPKPEAKAEADKPGITTAPITQGNKLRRNNLDPAIDKAIKQAGNMELADVYLKLKALALDEENPFTGALNGNALCYTNDDNEKAELSKEALRKRLKNRR